MSEYLEEPKSMETPPVNDFCSVCREDFNLPCQANCSHWFCGNCILRVWQHEPALRACKCPICRRLINLLIPSEGSVSQRNEPEAGEVLTNIERYNRLFGGGANSFIQRLHDLPFYLRRLSRELMDPERSLPFVMRARMLFAMILSGIYILSPIDILPEGILGVVGMLDDVFIALIFFLHIAAIYRTFLLSRHGGRRTWELLQQASYAWVELLLLVLIARLKLWIRDLNLSKNDMFLFKTSPNQSPIYNYGFDNYQLP